MHFSIKKTILFLSLPCSVPVWASTFTFYNKLESAVEIKWQLAGSDDKEKIVVPQRGRNAVSFAGAKGGLCMRVDNQTLSVRILPSGKAMYPLLISRDSFAYSELLTTNRITSVDIKTSAIDFERPQPCTDLSGTAGAAIKCNPQFARAFGGTQGRLCANVEFEIRETDDHYIVLVLL